MRLAAQKPRYGYRRLHAVLKRRGQAVNVKRVYRLYVEQGLAVRRRRRKRLVRDGVAEARLIRLTRCGPWTSSSMGRSTVAWCASSA